MFIYISNRKTNSFFVTKGSDFTVSVSKQETDLTPQMIARSVFNWSLKFRKKFLILSMSIFLAPTFTEGWTEGDLGSDFFRPVYLLLPITFEQNNVG